MNRITKFLLAGFLALGTASAATLAITSFKNEEVVETKASNFANVDYLKINGKRFFEDDFEDDLNYLAEEGWRFYEGVLYLRDYNGSSISFTMKTGMGSLLTVCPYGHNVITTEDDYSAGISVKGAAGQRVDWFYGEADTYVEINSKKDGIIVVGDNSYGTEIRFLKRDNDYKDTDSYLRINAGQKGIVCSNIDIGNHVNVYINSGDFCFVVHEKVYMQQDIFLTFGHLSFVCAISPDAVCNRYYKTQPYAYSCTRDYFHYVELGLGDSDKVILYGAEETIYKKILFFQDANPACGVGDSVISAMKYKYEVGKNLSFTFNNEPIPAVVKKALEQEFDHNNVRVEKEYDLRKNGAEDPILSGYVDTEDAATINFTLNEVALYNLTESLVLYEGNMEIGRIRQVFRITPYSYHTVTLDPSIKGVHIKQVGSYNPEAVKTGSYFRFALELEPYHNLPDNEQIYANGKEIFRVPEVAYSSNVFGIEEVTGDTVITMSANTIRYSFVTFYVGHSTVGSSNELYYENQDITMPLLSDIQSLIPEGYEFDYWQVGDRTTHYPCSTESHPVTIRINDNDAGVLRIDAHFKNLYNLVITDGHFYSDASCTQEITQAAPVAVGSARYTYFKFNQDLNEIVDGKLLYSYNKTLGTADIYESNNGSWFFEMTASDLVIEPVYKYVIDELTAENVVIPVAGEPLLERTIKAPKDANYKIPESSNWCYKIVGENKTSVYTYQDNNPYIFENDTLYEFSFYFSVPSTSDYIFNQDGYMRDGSRQFHIDGLDDTDYTLVSADFTNSYKENYKIVLRMMSVNRYAVSVTNGTAIVNGQVVTGALGGQEVLLSADVAPTGRVFDHWDITGVEVEENLLGNSRLSFVMPYGSVAAEAIYVEAPYFQITFDSNGGSGTMEDAKTYDGIYVLPECTFTAPAHKHFKAWEVNDREYGEGAIINISGNVSVKALWENDVCTVTFDANGGSGTMEPIEVNFGEEYTLPACDFIAPDGKEFKCWAIGETEITTETVTVEGDFTLKAVWKEVKDPHGGESSSEPSGGDSSEPVTPDKPKKKGCGGSIIAASILVPSLLGLGAFLLIKRKEK